MKGKSEQTPFGSEPVSPGQLPALCITSNNPPTSSTTPRPRWRQRNVILPRLARNVCGELVRVTVAAICTRVVTFVGENRTMSRKALRNRKHDYWPYFMVVGILFGALFPLVCVGCS